MDAIEALFYEPLKKCMKITCKKHLTAQHPSRTVEYMFAVLYAVLVAERVTHFIRNTPHEGATPRASGCVVCAASSLLSVKEFVYVIN